LGGAGAARRPPPLPYQETNPDGVICGRVVMEKR